MRAVVIALGKIGLPIATKIALAGHEVIGCDIDPRVVEIVSRGEPPFPGEAGLAEALAEVVSDGRLRVTGDTSSAVAESPELVIAVPPLIVDDHARPDFGVLDAVVADISRGLQAGTLVSVETTLPVGTTRERIAPALAAGSGLQAERDFYTVHSPERVYSGRIFRDLDTYPKLVGGISEDGERRGVELYRAFLSAEVRAMGSAEAAELTKLVETTYRDVNIALANEFARFADRRGVDVNLVIDAANSQPFSHIHRPGIGVGGHCIPVYPRFYEAGDADAQIPPLARAINDGMPAYAVGVLEQQLGTSLSGLTVLILGVSYRGAVKETAFSSAFGVRDELARRGARAVAADPLFDAVELRALGFEPWDGGAIDAAIVQADHPQYAHLTPAELPGVRAIIDGRGILERGTFTEAGVALRGIGSAA